MAHGITKTDKVAIRGSSGWHKLGNVILESDSFDEGWEKGGLTWPVIAEILTLRDGRKVDRKAILRADTNTILGTVGENWEVFQNSEMRDRILRPMVDTGLVKLESLGSLWGGKRVWGQGRVIGESAEVVPGDQVDMFALGAMGHDGGMRLFLGGTAQQVVCNNTLQAALDGGGLLGIRHTKNMRETIDSVRDALMEGIKEFRKTIELFKALAARRYTNDQLTTYLRKLFPNTSRAKAAEAKAKLEEQAKADFAALMRRPLRLDGPSEMDRAQARIEASLAPSRAHERIVEILEQGAAAGAAGASLSVPGVEGTAWGVYGAVTGYLTHEHGRSQDNRMAALAFGDGIGLKALTAAEEVFLKAA